MGAMTDTGCRVARSRSFCRLNVARFGWKGFGYRFVRARMRMESGPPARQQLDVMELIRVGHPPETEPGLDPIPARLAQAASEVQVSDEIAQRPRERVLVAEVDQDA